MNTKSLFLLLLLSHNFLYAQHIFRVVHLQNMPKFKEEYDAFINNNGDTIRHGSFKKISGRANNDGQILEIGRYQDNLREGEWQIYGGYGTFKADKKVGKWAYKEFLYERQPSVKKQLLETLNHSPILPFVSKYKIIQVYDYDKDSLIYYEESKDIFQGYGKYADCSVETFDTPAILIGGLSLIQTYTSNEIKYPQQAILNKVQGVVKYGLKINERGQVTDVVLLEGLGSGCDEEVLNAMKKHKDNFIFIPAKKEGKNVPMCLELYFHFKLL